MSSQDMKNLYTHKQPLKDPKKVVSSTAAPYPASCGDVNLPREWKIGHLLGNIFERPLYFPNVPKPSIYKQKD